MILRMNKEQTELSQIELDDLIKEITKPCEHEFIMKPLFRFNEDGSKTLIGQMPHCDKCGSIDG